MALGCYFRGLLVGRVAMIVFGGVGGVGGGGVMTSVFGSTTTAVEKALD